MPSPRPSSAPAIVPTLLLSLALGGCQPGDGGGEADATNAESAAAVAVDTLPDAIVGEAGPPRGRDLRYFDDDTATVGYLSVPEGDGPFPALILVHEWNGLVDRVRQMADAMAAEGYVSLAVDLYGGRTGSSREENMALVREVRSDQESMIANLNAALSFLKSRDDVTGRVAAMGWCFGGGVALTFALDGENHEGTAIFYGQLVDDPDRLARIDHRVYGTFAELDDGIPPDAVRSFEAALRDAGVPNDVHIYDGVNHGFWLRVDEDPEARRAPALDAWNRLKAYLTEVLG